MSALETPTQLPCITNIIQTPNGFYLGSPETNLGHYIMDGNSVQVIVSQPMSINFLSFLHSVRTAGPLTIERISDLTKLLGAQPFLDSFLSYNSEHQIIIATSLQLAELSRIHRT